MIDLSPGLRAALPLCMNSDARVVLLTETTGPTVAALRDAHGCARVRLVPVADRATAAMGLGMALAGRPVVMTLPASHRLSAIAEVLVEGTAIGRAGELTAPLVVVVPYGHAAGDRVDAPVGALLPATVQVRCARDAATGAHLISEALTDRVPTVILEPRVRTAPDDAAMGDTVTQLRSGSLGTIITWGALTQDAMQVAETLANEGLDFEVVDLVRLSPIDRDVLGGHIARTGRVCVLHPNDPAVADRVIQSVVDTAFLTLEAPPARVTSAQALIDAARHAATW